MIAARYTIECDGGSVPPLTPDGGPLAKSTSCLGKRGPSSTLASEAENAAIAAGWTRASSLFHLCPACTEVNEGDKP